MPADAAAEHTDSGSETAEKAPTGGDTAKSESTDSADTTEKIEKPADPDATVQADSDATVQSGSEATEKVGTDASVKSDPDATEKVDTDATEKVDKAAAPKSDEGDDASVSLGKSGTAEKDAAAVTASESGDAEKSGSDAKDEKSEAGAARRFPLPALAGFAVLLVAAVVAVGVFFFLAGDRQEELDHRAAATKAACDFGNSFATYSGDKADDYISRLDQGATGEWKKLVSEIGPELKTRFAQTQVNSTAADVQCGYESGADDNARVVLVIDQQFTTAGAQPQQQPGRVKVAANVDMQKIDGTWLVANFDTPMMQQ
ncbi:hypothetical protein [Nocardia sp. NPDC024068]|uniref:hypothetical protein n=1 Tax=Nocardia sp. NPDC024068 TaxID=3157197 RepID=UPI0033F9C9CD